MIVSCSAYVACFVGIIGYRGVKPSFLQERSANQTTTNHGALNFPPAFAADVQEGDEDIDGERQLSGGTRRRWLA